MNKEERIKILQEVIQIQSVNGKEALVADYLAILFEQSGIQTEKIKYAEDRENLVAIYQRGDGKVLGLSGHQDVVAPGDTSQWRFPPFSAEMAGDKLYGRGSTDMKAGLVALALAMIETKEEQVPMQGTLKFMATVGEEVGELGANQLTAKGYVDDLDALIIGEPTGAAIVYAHKGSINYTVFSHGKSAHSSMPKEGVNSIANINEFITQANQKMQTVTEQYKNAVLGETAHSITIIKGGEQVNSIPALTTLQGNIRTIPEFDNDQVKTLLQDIVTNLNQRAGFHLELQIDDDIYPVESNPNSELIQVIKNTISQELPVVGMSPTTDAAAFTKSAKVFDLVIYGPGVPDLPHQVDEYVSIENYLQMIDYYKLIFKEYLK